MAPAPTAIAEIPFLSSEIIASAKNAPKNAGNRRRIIEEIFLNAKYNKRAITINAIVSVMYVSDFICLALNTPTVGPHINITSISGKLFSTLSFADSIEDISLSFTEVLLLPFFGVTI